MASIEIATIMAANPYKQKDAQRKTSGSFSNQFFKDVKEGFNKIPTLKIKNRCNHDKLKHFLKLSSKRLQTEIVSKANLILKYRNQVIIHMKHKDVELSIPLVVQLRKQGQLREAMVVAEKYCDILLHRFAFLQNVKSLNDTCAEAVSSIIWVSQHLALDELRHVAEQLTNKYGKCYAEACKKKQVATVNEQLVSHISLSTASIDVIEKILLDIAEEYNIEYIPENKDCQKNQVFSPKEQLVSQISSSTTYMDIVENNLLDFSDEYKDDDMHKNKEVSAIDDLLDIKLDKEVGLIVEAPLVLENCSPNPSGVAQLGIPNARCQAPSPGGSCLATSPGGTKTWCNFDISPAKNQILNPFCPHNISDLASNISDLASSPFVLNGGSISRSNPFTDDNNYLLDMDIAKKESDTLKDIDIQVTNPFKELMFQDDAKSSSTYHHDLFEVDVPDNLSSSWKSKHLNSPFKRTKAKNQGVDVQENESSSQKSKHVDPELLFQLDIEDML